MRWKPALTVAELNKIIDEHQQSDLSDSDIVTAINNKYGKDYKLNIVNLFKKIRQKSKK